jgi:hypothetical protein
MAKPIKQSKKSHSSSLGLITCSTTKPNCGSNINSDGFTTVGKKSDSSKTPLLLAQPSPLMTTQHNHLSLVSPSSYNHIHPEQDVTNCHLCDISTPVDHTNTSDDDYHNPEASAHWHGFTSGTTTRSIHDLLQHSRPASQQSSSGLSFLDDSNRVPHRSSCIPPAPQPNDSGIDAH